MDKIKRLFIDPASKSAGWALFEGRTLIDHGTILVDGGRNVEHRLADMFRRFQQLGQSLDWEEAHIEQLVRMTHIYTHYSVGVIMAALCTPNNFKPVRGDVPISSWQKVSGWKTGRALIAGIEVESEDEAAAISMGIYWVRTYIAQEENSDQKITVVKQLKKRHSCRKIKRKA